MTIGNKSGVLLSLTGLGLWSGWWGQYIAKLELILFDILFVSKKGLSATQGVFEHNWLFSLLANTLVGQFTIVFVGVTGLFA